MFLRLSFHIYLFFKLQNWAKPEALINSLVKWSCSSHGLTATTRQWKKLCSTGFGHSKSQRISHHIVGSKVLAILLKRWILPLGGVAKGLRSTRLSLLVLLNEIMWCKKGFVLHMYPSFCQKQALNITFT